MTQGDTSTFFFMSNGNSSAHLQSGGSVHLDALRGAAALLVFLNHTRGLFFSSFLVSAAVTATTGGVSDTAENFGEIKVASAAVVVFFVLSGYLVGGSVLKSMRANRWSWKSYATKRLVRLMIVLIPAVVLGASLDHLGIRLFGPGSVYTAPPGLDLQVAGDLIYRLRPVVLLGNIAFLQGIVVPIEGTNVSIWSLANEFWYYVAFPLAATAFFSSFSRLVRAVCLVAACGVLWFVGSAIAWLFPIWLMGAAISIVPMRLEEARGRILVPVMAVLLIGSVFGLRLLHVAAVPAEYGIGALAALLLYTMLSQRAPSRAGVYRAVSGFFSKISYSLYLIHLPLAVFLCGLVNSPWKPHVKTPANIAWFLLGDAVVIGLVYLFWLAFESNTDRVRERFFALEGKKS